MVSAGKGIVPPGEDTAMGTKIAMRLMVPFLGKGYCVRVDNYYTLPELVDKLLQHKTDVCDTVWPTRKVMPPFKDLKLKKGDIGEFQREKYMVLQWHDKKLVVLLSTVHDVTVVKGPSKRKSGETS